MVNLDQIDLTLKCSGCRIAELIPKTFSDYAAQVVVVKHMLAQFSFGGPVPKRGDIYAVYPDGSVGKYLERDLEATKVVVTNKVFELYQNTLEMVLEVTHDEVTNLNCAVTMPEHNGLRATLDAIWIDYLFGVVHVFKFKYGYDAVDLTGTESAAVAAHLGCRAMEGEYNQIHFHLFYPLTKTAYSVDMLPSEAKARYEMAMAAIKHGKDSHIWFNPGKHCADLKCKAIPICRAYQYHIFDEMGLI